MTFTSDTYRGFVAQDTKAQRRLFRQYEGANNWFDLVIVGSGIGGGVLADDLADRVGDSKRILVLEAGSYLYPTHVYNVCRFPNADVARHFGSGTFWQGGDRGTRNYIGEEPQLNLGGRSIFWSGLIPQVQDWELQFFPGRVRSDLQQQQQRLLRRAGDVMNESRTMGVVARAVVERLRRSPIAADFEIVETPRALHQPYLKADGSTKESFFTEPTGVFNTAELLINQLGLAPEGPRRDDAGCPTHRKTWWAAA